MKVDSTHARIAGLGLTALIVSSGWAGAASPQQQRRRTHTVTTRRIITTVGSGTVIPIRLDEAINSLDAQRGDKFTATVTDVNSYSSPQALPNGTKVEGVVRSAQPMEGKNPGTLDLEFDRVTLPNGRSYAISGTPIALDSKSVVRSNGRVVAKSGRTGPNRLTYVGIGAGAGLLLNMLGHRKGTLTDVLVGAGVGYGAGALIKGGSGVRNVELKEGATMGVSLNRNLAMAR